MRTGRPVPDHRTGETFARIDLAAAAATRPNSVGDCNEDGLVTVSEVSRGIRILLGQVGIAQCPALDANGDGTATIDEVVSAVNVRRYRCPLPPVMAV
ncbi:MAG: hypothetical protein KatS3mg077_2226 [Candidatus Binatia bacterium]|nr:MAG: hypothetical protein KatS3mg077_2226 [Candidatus Binatia bacterium]